MSYEYTDPKREHEPHALPDVEVFDDTIIEIDTECCGVFDVFADGEYDQGDGTGLCPSCERMVPSTFITTDKIGYWYAYGFPGCLWDSDPIGPFETYEKALEDARDNAGVYDE